MDTTWWRARTRVASCIIVALAVIAGAATPARAQDADSDARIRDLERKHEELMQVLEAQQRRIDELEADRGADSPDPSGPRDDRDPTGADGEAAGTAPDAEASPDRRRLTGDLDPDAEPEEGSFADRVGDWLDLGTYVSWNELTAGESRFKIYGMIRLDMAWSDSQFNDTLVPFFVKSEDQNNAGGAKKDDADFTMHVRLTRLGLDFTGPEIEMLGSPDLTGKIEIDFFNKNNAFGAAESRAGVRIRHGYLRLQWGDFGVLAGQTYQIIAPLYPSVNSELPQWGAGNLGDRAPQLRFEYTPKVGSGKLTLTTGIVLTSAVDNEDQDGDGFRDGEQSGVPSVEGRAAYAFPIFDGQHIVVGAWGHFGREQTEDFFATERDFNSIAYGIDVTIPIYEDVVWVKGELFAGENLDDVRGGILQGANLVTGDEIRSRGGFVELGVKPASWLKIYAGYSRDDPDDSDLNVGDRSNNEVIWGAIVTSFGPLSIGTEYLYWETDFEGFGPGRANRAKIWIAYKF